MERNQTSLLQGNSQTPVPLLYWGIIFLLTVAFSFFPLFSFLSEVSKHHGPTSSLLFLGSQRCTWKYFLGRYATVPPRNRELDGRVYIKLGVQFFGLLVPNGGGINRFVR